jgi:hypothetical protein
VIASLCVCVCVHGVKRLPCLLMFNAPPRFPSADSRQIPWRTSSGPKAKRGSFRERMGEDPAY